MLWAVGMAFVWVAILAAFHLPWYIVWAPIYVPLGLIVVLGTVCVVFFFIGAYQQARAMREAAMRTWQRGPWG